MTNQISATLSGRRLAMLASAAMAALAFAAPARAQQGLADFFNEWDTPTLDPQTNSFGPTGIQMVFAGDAITDGCLPPQVTADSLINPFYAWQVWAFGGGHAHHTSVIYDITDNETLVTMSNTVPLIVPPPLSGSGFPGPTDGNGSGGQTYHSGLNQGFPGNCATNPQVKKRWIWKRHHTIQYQDIPFVQSVWPGQVNQGNIKLGQAAVIYLETKAPAVTGTWNWVSYVPPQDGSKLTFQLQNNGTVPVTLGVVGIVTGRKQPPNTKCWSHPTCKQNEANLDQLNNTGYPVPGQPKSPFTPLPDLDGVTLDAGQVIDVPAP